MTSTRGTARRVGKGALFAPCPRGRLGREHVRTRSLSSGRPKAGPVGFSHPTGPALLPRLWLIASVVMATLIASSPKAFAQGAPSFAGKTVDIYTGYSVGGGYDLYTRLIARHIGRHLPGNPSV